MTCYVGVEGHVAVGQAGVPSSLREGPGRGYLQTLSQPSYGETGCVCVWGSEEIGESPEEARLGSHWAQVASETWECLGLGKHQPVGR